MVIRWILPVSGIVITGLLFIAGCAPGLTTGPASSSRQSGAPGGQRGGGIGSSQVSPSARSRSLEAFQRGMEIPYTSASSPSSPLKDVYFEFNRFALRPEARQALKDNAQWLKNHSSDRLEIEGHADDRGTNEYNLALGARRAQAVKVYLEALGISLNLLSTISYGEELPVCKTRGEDCRQKNRRAHFVIIGSGPAS